MEEQRMEELRNFASRKALQNDTWNALFDSLRLNSKVVKCSYALLQESSCAFFFQFFCNVNSFSQVTFLKSSYYAANVWGIAMQLLMSVLFMKVLPSVKRNNFNCTSNPFRQMKGPICTQIELSIPTFMQNDSTIPSQWILVDLDKYTSNTNFLCSSLAFSSLQVYFFIPNTNFLSVISHSFAPNIA